MNIQPGDIYHRHGDNSNTLIISKGLYSSPLGIKYHIVSVGQVGCSGYYSANIIADILKQYKKMRIKCPALMTNQLVNEIEN